MFLLGVMNENGDGVVRSENSAVGWYRRASRLGHSEAEARLGIVTATLHSQTGPLVGQRVIVHSLGTSKSSSSPHSPPSSAATLLNGATGLVLGYDASTGYCTVELSDGRTTKFRPENLVRRCHRIDFSPTRHVFYPRRRVRSHIILFIGIFRLNRRALTCDTKLGRFMARTQEVILERNQV